MKKCISVLLVFFCALVTISAQENTQILAKIGERDVTAADLDPQTQQIIEQLPAAIAAMRQREFEKDVAYLLFSTEAAARNTTVENLLETQVRRKVVAPTAAQVQSVLNNNSERFAENTPDQAKQIISNYLIAEQEDRLTAGFSKQLQTKYKVQFGAKVNAADLQPASVLATVAGKTLTAKDFNRKMLPFEYGLRQNVYLQTKNALDRSVYSTLILLESRRTNVASEDLIRREISDKIRQPTDADARKFYDARKASFPKVAFDGTVKNQILTFLTDEQRAKLEADLRQRLSKTNNVQILLRAPVAPVLQINTANSPSKGAPNAPVTLVMFSDFQCSACARTHPLVKEILKKYAGKVRLVVRNFPLVTVHANAFRAAQAAAAANAQGKFFEYIELLYQNQNQLDDASLKKYARQIGLNAAQFETDLNGKRFDEQIRQDIRDGQNLGISGTPTIYVNGVILSNLTDDAVKSLIDKNVK